MKKTNTVVLITIMLLILFWGTIAPAAAEEAPFIPVTAPITETLTGEPTGILSMLIALGTLFVYGMKGRDGD